MASFALDEGARLGLVHTDVHLGNWFVTPQRQMGLCDWAAVARGQGPRDLAYALMSALAIDDRRAWEDGLIERYAERVGEASGSRVAPADVRDAYRRQTMHGFCFWLYTLGSGGLQPATQAKETARLNIERMSQAVVDLETLAALEP
jgi:aminoglycoside phosphotransferase (APT) family kinase protein